MDLLERARKFDYYSKLLLAPLFLFLAYFLIPQSIYVNKLLPIGGSFLCLFFQKKGFYLAVLLIFIDSIFQHLASTSHFWLIGFEISLALSFWIFYDTCKNIKESDEISQNAINEKDVKYLEKQKLLDERILQYQDTIQALEDDRKDLELSLKNFQSEMKSYLQLIDTLRETKELEIQTREKLSQELMDKRQIINTLEQEVNLYKEDLAKMQNSQKLEKQCTDLICELNYFRVKQFQTGLINEALAYFTNQEIEKIKANSTDSFDKKNYLYGRQLIANYNQLKGQFKEKDQILHRTRKELYENKTQYEVLKNMFDELKLKPKKTELQFIQQIDDLLVENEQLLKENKELEKILEKTLMKDHSLKSHDHFQ